MDDDLPSNRLSNCKGQPLNFWRLLVGRIATMSRTERTTGGLLIRVLARVSLACLIVLAIVWTGRHSEAKTDLQIQDTGFVRYATGINIYGSPKDWYILAARYGYYVSDEPVNGSVVSFEPGAYGTNNAYGFLGVVIYYRDDGGYWRIGTRYAYPTERGSYYDDYYYAKEQEFRVLKKDPKVRFIYRNGMNAHPKGYYYYPEYVGYNIIDKQYPFSDGTEEVTVYPDKNYVKTYVRAGRIVRVLAKAEVGETLWVFIQTPYNAGATYARTYYYSGKESLKKFDAYSSDAYRMYYAKDYGDTVLDLGYADYSKIAGDSGEVTIIIKKGDDPKQLETLQTISLYVAPK